MAMDIEREYASKGVANGGLVTGIIGTAGFGVTAMTALLNALNKSNNAPAASGTEVAAAAMIPALVAAASNAGSGCSCSEDHTVNRYELELQQQIAAKDAQIALRDANTYGDQKMLEMYQYIDGQLKDIRSTLGTQAVHNQRTEDSFVLVRQDLSCVKNDLTRQIEIEAERRCCGDNSIVTYANATFYPKMVADVTTGTDTTAQTLYNPLPNCGGCCGN